DDPRRQRNHWRGRGRRLHLHPVRGRSPGLGQRGHGHPSGDLGQSKNLDQSVDDLKAFANAAPRDIRADLQTVAEGYDAYAKVLVDAHFDPSSGKPPSQEVINKLQEESQKLNQAEFRDAATRVNTW